MVEEKAEETKKETKIETQGRKKEEHIQKTNWYNKHYKILLILPIIMFVFSIFYLFQFNANHGDIVLKDISLTGGTSVTVFDEGVDIDELKSTLRAEFPDLIVRKILDIRTRNQQAFIVETRSGVEEVKTALEKYLGYQLNQDNSSIEFSGSAISQGFYQQLRFALFISFILMATVVFIIFRTPIRSLSVIIASFADIIMTIVVIDILGIQLSTAGIVALLMLIGYSVDVDILLTTRVFKDKEGTLNQRIFGAFKTGITMTLTAIAAVGIALLFTYSLSPTLSQMFIIIIIGLGFDILNCWITNASILKWYMEAKKLT